MILINIKNSSKITKGTFLRGFFDSEGSAYFRIKYGITDRKIELCNNDFGLIKFCKELLEELGIKTRNIDKRFRSERTLRGRKLSSFNFYRFTLKENKENFKKFRDLVGFSIKRKQDKLDGLIASYREFRSKWGDLKNKVLEFRKNKTYTETRKEFSFIPKGTIDRWLYIPDSYPRVSEE